MRHDPSADPEQVSTIVAIAPTRTQFQTWLASAPSEDELRETYLTLERERAQLWTPGHLESFRRDRYERDAEYVARLVEVKRALARHWQRSGQLGTGSTPEPVPA
jgi:hypothetical protein